MTLTVEFHQKLDNFINLLNKVFGDVNLKYTRTIGRKYVKVLMHNYENTSVYAFIDHEGNVFKAADRNTPAPHARGSINNENPLDGMEKYSPKYLK